MEQANLTARTDTGQDNDKDYGKVFIVGAGPGAPDLVTVRGQRVIEEADLVIYADSLVQESVAGLAREGAEIIASAALTLEQVVEKMLAATRTGQTVVRVHSGDPSLYGALYEQLARLDEAGIEYEIVPGVSAVFAAAARLGVELTVPQLAQSLILTRMSGRASAVPETENLTSLAAHHTSLAIYLSITRCREMVSELLAGGYGPETPTAVLYQISWPDEQIIVCRLDELADQVARAGFSRQTLVLVGSALSPALDRKRSGGVRSQLYHPAHSHVFRKGEGRPTVDDTLETPKARSTEPKAAKAATVAILSLTKNGTALAAKLQSGLSGSLVYAPVRFAAENMQAYRGKPLELVRELFDSQSQLVLIMPLGVAVRAVGQLAESKQTDPGVVVLDEAGRFAISMLSGHLGGANRMAEQVAAITGGQAVITTASDVQGLPSLDLLGKEEGWQIAGSENLTAASAAWVNGETVGLWQEVETLTVAGLDRPNLLRQDAPEQLIDEKFKAALVVTYHRPGVFQQALRDKAVFYHPPALVVGIGCRRGVSADQIEQALRAVLTERGLAFEAISEFASADLKQDEAGLLELAGRYNLPVKFYTAEALNGVAAEQLVSSSQAQRLLGVQGVAEPSALLASGATSLLVAKVGQENVTIAIAVKSRKAAE